MTIYVYVYIYISLENVWVGKNAGGVFERIPTLFVWFRFVLFVIRRKARDGYPEEDLRRVSLSRIKTEIHN